MRVTVAVVIQVFVSVLIVGGLMPPLLATVPAVRSGRAGVALVIVGVVIVFGLLRLVWPRPKQQ